MSGVLAGHTITSGMWLRNSGEQPCDYGRRLMKAGETPSYIVRALRMEFGLELSETKALVENALPPELSLDAEFRALNSDG